MKMSTAALQHPDGFCRLVHGGRWYKVVDGHVVCMSPVEHGRQGQSSTIWLPVDDLVAEDWLPYQVLTMAEPTRIIFDDPEHLSVYAGKDLVVRVPSACSDHRVGEGLEAFVGRHGGLRATTHFLMRCRDGVPLTNRGAA